MSYTDNLKNGMDEYEILVNEYGEKQASEQYVAAVNAAPFEFISAIHICELLEAFNTDKPTKMRYNSASDAMATYMKIKDFKIKKEEVLEMADAIVDAGECADRINKLVSNNVYLPNSLKVEKNETLFDFAKKAIEMISYYDDYLSKRFRDRFTESCIESLSTEELDKLVTAGIIREVHMDNIAIHGSKAYEDRFRHLCVDVFGKQDISLGKYNQALVGVAYETDEGVSRQQLLAQIQDRVNAGEHVELTAELGTFTPELGKPEPAVSIKWEGQTIGFLQKEAAKQISEFSDRSIILKAELNKIVGGENDNRKFGCVIDLEIRTMIKGDTEQSMDAGKD